MLQFIHNTINLIQFILLSTYKLLVTIIKSLLNFPIVEIGLNESKNFIQNKNEKEKKKEFIE